MPSNKRSSKRRTTEQQYNNDIFRVVLTVSDHQTLARLLKERLLDVGPIQSRLGESEINVDLFLTQNQITQLTKERWKIKVHENMSEIGRKRQKEVGLGDRFERGEIAPKGLGKKWKGGAK
jgi:hypothetical protein